MSKRRWSLLFAALAVGAFLAPAGFVLGGTATLYTVDLVEDLDPEVHNARVHE